MISILDELPDPLLQVMFVVTDCCVQEKVFNPYTILYNKLYYIIYYTV